MTSAKTEQQRWRSEIERVRVWQRPKKVLWVATLILILVLTYLGLILGGYLPVPELLRGVADFWWSRM